MGFCKIIALGKLGRDPETRSVAGSTVTSFSIAVDTGYGERKVSTWYNVSAWGKQGELIQSNVSKGDQVLIDGELSERKYTKTDGSQGSSLDIRLEKFSFIGGNGRQGSGGGYSDRRKSPEPRGYGQQLEDEIEF